MSYCVKPLAKEKFQHLYGLSKEQLNALGVHTCIADAPFGYPCRVSLTDVQPGERLLLLNYKHLTGSSPYASSHAIFIKDQAQTSEPIYDRIPDYLSKRMLSIRAFNSHKIMLEGVLTDGMNAEQVVSELLLQTETSFLHIHSATHGCYLAKVERYEFNL